MDEKFLKPYDPAATESRIYEMWEESGYFNPDNLPDAESREPFSIVLPPPNVTGILHLGHAYEDSLQDAVIRYQRMRGKRALWIPGTDSAAIATQARVEKNIQKEEGKSRHDLGREELVRRVSEFAKNSESTILGQVKRMGASLDWSRYAYTMDEKRNLAVATAFKRMYDAGLVYRGNRIVNWDPKGQTTISDDEIVYEERKAKLYTFKYSKDFPIPVATTRLETKVGDVAVAVHPDDARYKEYVGKTYDVVFCGVPLSIRVIADYAVDPAFGTGALGVTPAHSMIDWEIAERHDLPKDRIVINEYAKMSVEGRLSGLKVLDAREAVVQWLESEGLLEKEEDIMQNVSIAERTGGIIEPLPKLQWFVGVDRPFTLEHSEIPGIESGTTLTLKELMRAAVEHGGVSMPQEGFRNAYFHWIDNLHDWCVSRQIWFGHRIPVWYKRQLGGPHQAIHFKYQVLLNKLEMTEDEFQQAAFEWQELPDYLIMGGSENIQIGMTLMVLLKDKSLIDEEWIRKNEIKQPIYLEEELYCGVNPPDGIGWEQDPDVFDTWFSSQLWTFSTLGWPEETKDLETYHPTSFMSPAYEILNLWVSRMILASGFLLGQVPFRTVLIHGLVRDSQGRKFSKSLNNGIDPLDMIQKYGADALRMGLLVGAAVGSDIKFDEQRVKGYKNFANKLWNITRFILENFEGQHPHTLDENELWKEIPFNEWGIWKLIPEVTEDMENYRFHLASEKIYHYIWHEFADKTLEECKAILRGSDENAKKKVRFALMETFTNCLKLLHPFMPFVTEEIWQSLPDSQGMLMVSPWPAS